MSWFSERSSCVGDAVVEGRWWEILAVLQVAVVSDLAVSLLDPVRREPR